MLNIGIVGLGFMGRRHYEIYLTLPPERFRIAAIAEPEEKRRRGDWTDTTGNIGPAGHMQNISGLKTYESYLPLLRDPEVDMVDITLPSFLHHDAVVAALQAGKHVVCEKPMALDYRQCLGMIDAARRSGRQLYVGQCIRFWPAYARAVEMVRDGGFGRVLTARFLRLTSFPRWGWYAADVEGTMSGGAPLDLHIHDADFIAYLFGKPKTVTAFTGGRSTPSGSSRPDHILVRYGFGDNAGPMITAEAGWEYADGRPFSMTFDIHMEKGTLTLAADETLTLYRDGRPPEVLDLPPGDGWTYELTHFANCAATGKPSSIVTPEEAAASVKLVEAELESARTGKTISLD